MARSVSSARPRPYTSGERLHVQEATRIRQRALAGGQDLPRGCSMLPTSSDRPLKGYEADEARQMMRSCI